MNRIRSRTRPAVLLAAVMAAGCGQNSATPSAAEPRPGPKADSAPSPTPGPAPAPAAQKTPDVKTTAEALTQQVLADPMAVSQKYHRKVVELEGVTVAPTGVPPAYAKGKVFLSGAPKPYGTDRPTVVVTPVQPTDLPPGHKVRVVGTVLAANVLSVDLGDCTVTDLGAGGEPTPVRKAAEVAAAFAKGEEAAAKQYGLAPGSFLAVEGEVAEVKAEGGTTVVRLAGTDGVSIVGTPTKDNAAGLSKGGKARVCGVYAGYDAAAKVVKLDSVTTQFLP